MYTIYTTVYTYKCMVLANLTYAVYSCASDLHRASDQTKCTAVTLQTVH